VFLCENKPTGRPPYKQPSSLLVSLCYGFFFVSNGNDRNHVVYHCIHQSVSVVLCPRISQLLGDLYMHVAGDWFQSAQGEALLGVENLRWRSTNKMPLLHSTYRDQQLWTILIILLPFMHVGY
jgi:hypothetical protein